MSNGAPRKSNVILVGLLAVGTAILSVIALARF